MGNLHAAPLKDKKCELFTTHNGLEIGSSEMQGWRLEMEDSHVTMSMPSKPDHTFVAVFDGHGGSSSAEFAAASMLKIIEDTSFWKQYINGGASDVDLLGRALSLAFLDTDAALRTEIYSQGRNLSGCTCISAIITPAFIVCGNAGDSRCVLGTNMMVKGMSKDHKPCNELEQRRIEHAGGKVHAGRVDGDLAVSRAFGDFRFKNRLDLGPSQQKISCYPDISVHERSGLDEMLLLACDGLWDVFSNEAAVAAMRNIFASGECTAADVAGNMVDIALRRGSKDNITAVVVRLPGVITGRRPPQSRNK